MKTNNRHRCLNCDSTFQGNFCPHCGQAADTSRFQTRETLYSVLQAFWGSDNKFLTTSFHLLRRPGILVRDYLLGRRQKYFRPVPMLFFLVAVYAVLSYWRGDNVSSYDTISVAGEGMESASPTMTRIIQLFNSLMKNKVYVVLFGAVLYILPYRFFFRHYRVKRLDGTSEPLNLAEHFFTQIYIGCISMIFSFIAFPFTFIPGIANTIRNILFVLPFLWSVTMYSQICRIKWLKSAWLNIIATIASIFIAIFFILLVFGLVYGFENAR